MKKFHFRLQAVEIQRRSVEREHLRLLGEARRALLMENNRKKSYLAELDAALERRQNAGSNPTTIHSFRLEDLFILGTKKNIASTELAIRRAEKAVQKAFVKYMKVRQSLKIVEKLRENAFQKYRRDLAKFETKRLDDLNVMRFRINRQLAMGGDV